MEENRVRLILFRPVKLNKIVDTYKKNSFTRMFIVKNTNNGLSVA